MNLGFILFIIGVYGFILNRKNYLLTLVALEIILLGITLLIAIFSINHDDILGQIFGLYIIAIAACEAAIALSILVSFYKLRGTINIDSINNTKLISIKTHY
jgi:NADH:ubiquinone oxidoreductase subunit K